MSQFTVRIELHQAQFSDYERLHAAMAQRGFSRMITGDSGKKYQLPLAEYDLTASLTTKQVLDEAKNAASKTGKEFSALVTESLTRAWCGLSNAR